MPMRPAVFFKITDRGDVRATLGLRRNVDGSVQTLPEAIPDGDTVQVNLEGSGSLRLLGVDTPEMRLSGSSVGSERWRAFFADPALLDRFALDPALRADLASRLGEGAAENHRRHAEAAEAGLTAMVTADMAALGATPETFRVFVAFSYDVFDRYARFLAFVNRDQREANRPAPRPRSYNERLLEAGLAEPYFIWPNVAPFRDAPTVLDAVIPPGAAAAFAARGDLGLARGFVAAARAAGLGVFAPADPLRLSAFELRFLADGRLPSRAVIDLAGAGELILRPQSYHRIPNPEDRLFIPPEFVPAFVSRGWRLEGW